MSWRRKKERKRASERGGIALHCITFARAPFLSIPFRYGTWEKEKKEERRPFNSITDEPTSRTIYIHTMVPSALAGNPRWISTRQSHRAMQGLSLSLSLFRLNRHNTAAERDREKIYSEEKNKRKGKRKGEKTVIWDTIIGWSNTLESLSGSAAQRAEGYLHPVNPFLEKYYSTHFTHPR